MSADHQVQAEVSRRDALERLALGGAGIASAGALALLLRVGDAFAQAEGDAAILEAATRLEQVAVLMYGAAIESGVLDAEATRVAELFRDHEQQHADALGAALEALGGVRPPALADVTKIDAVLRGLGIEDADARFADQDSILTLAIEIENATVAAYLAAHRSLQDANLLQTAASIMANEGQHLVVLRQALGRSAVPRPFETGRV